MGHDYCWEWMRSFPMFMPMFMILGCILFVYVIYRMFFKKTSNPSAFSSTETKDENSAIEILKRRYAKGEITKEEFEEMKKELIK